MRSGTLGYVLDGRRRTLRVEVPTTRAEMADGLRHRPDSPGMIFLLPTPMRRVVMYMDAVSRPLDFLFVARETVVHAMREITEDVLYVGAPIDAVIELPAGVATDLRLGRGSRVELR